MAFSDDVWAFDRYNKYKDLFECSSFRVSLNGSVHRFVSSVTASDQRLRWASLCMLQPTECPPALHGDEPVTCIVCIAEGG